jgi:hypothetical protein
VRLANSSIVHEREPLPFRIFEVERQAAVALGNLAGCDSVLAQ